MLISFLLFSTLPSSVARVTSDKSVSSQRSLKAFGHLLLKSSLEMVNTSVMLMLNEILGTPSENKLASLEATLVETMTHSLADGGEV